jgi:MFS family permease
MSPGRSNWTGIAFGLSLASMAAYQQFKLPPALPVLLETYGYDRTLAGGFMSIYALAGLLLSLPLGRLVQRTGTAGPTLAGLGVMVLGNAVTLAWPENGWIVLAGRAFEGAGFAVLAITGPVLANAHASARHLPLVVAMTASWIPVGQLAATALAPAAFAWTGWQGLWVVAILAAAGMAAWTLRLRAGHRVDLAAGFGPAAAPEAAPPSPRQRRNLLLAAAIFMLWVAQYFAYMTWLPQYLVEVHGLSVSMAVVGYTVPVAVLIATNMAVGLVLRTGAPVGPLLVLGLASQTAIWWLLPWTGPGVGGIASLIVYGIGAGICPTCLFAMPSVITGPGRAAASAFGVIMTGRNVGVLIGPVLLAQAFVLAGAWDVAAPLFGGVTAGALLLGLWLAGSLSGARYGTSR